jgi:glutaminyl-tRNA synthetase
MPTLMGFKRRGYTPSMINGFVDRIGVSRKGNENVTDIKLLEFFAREELDHQAERTFGVLDPVLLEIVNPEEGAQHQVITAPLFPTAPERGNKTLHLGKHIYIDKEDFSEEHEGGFYGLTPQQPVFLKYGPIVELVEIVKNDDGSLNHVKVKILPNYAQKLKGYIHWVSKDHSVDAIVRLYNYLFKVKEVGDDWEQ